jgi:5-(carboxyamino)imidazole ribonucleotide synthase
MKNLIGKEEGIANISGIEEVYNKFDSLQIHLYGKKEVKKGRKMGHITVCSNTVDEAIDAANKAHEMIKFFEEFALK